MTDEDRISILIEDAIEGSTKAALPNLAKHAAARTVEVSGDILRANLRRFLAQFAELLDDGTLANTNVVIDEVELSLAVTANGSIELVGKLAAGSQAGVKVKLKRRLNQT